MNHRLIAPVLSLVLGSASVAHAQTAPSAMDIVNKVVAASAVLDASKLAGLYADNAVFVDEGPIVIYGPNVGVDWLTRVNKKFAERHMTHFTGTASAPTIAQIKADGAYVVVPMELSANVGSDKHFHESGLFTFTLVPRAGAWKITSQVWTVLTESVK